MEIIGISLERLEIESMDYVDGLMPSVQHDIATNQDKYN